MNEKFTVIIIDTQKDKHGNFVPCIVKENEKGYFITDWQWGQNRAIAQKIADDYNTRLGLSKKQVIELTLQSMSPRRH